MQNNEHDQGCGDKGATAVEYAIMLALIAAVIFGAVAAMGLSVTGLFDSVNEQFSSAPAASPPT